MLIQQSYLFTKTRKEAPSDETAKNAQLLIRAGYIHKEMSGVYDYLPLGLKVIQNIKNIVSEEMEALGSQEILMSTLQNKDVWVATDRWDDDNVDVWFKSQFKSGAEIGFGWSHEEPVTTMMKSHVMSYQDLPVYVHQFQNKLRNEVRAKSGIMRCREFIMKDMYSYSRDEAAHTGFYQKATQAYMNVFKRVGLGDITYLTSASGGVFTDKFSHEFQTLCEAGEDIIYVHKREKVALNEEIFNDQTLEDGGWKKEDFELKKAAEVGNIFTFGTKKCEELGLTVMDAHEGKKPVFLGSYGIGITRLFGVLAEIFSDDKGLMWPAEVAPADVHVLALQDSVKAQASAFAKQLGEKVDVLYDDRASTP
ncbi:MAG: prolyl-tRNA synthetase, partial [Candidatus Andersenbacteria bacterium]|nr:prolyl-tRNA synthetase [Candidatus Andersenbacteria bacterium]